MNGVLGEIYDGWKNLIFENEQAEAIAKERIKICAGCEEEQIKKCEFFTDGKTCSICHCYMPAKARSMKPQTVCPEKKW